MKKYYVLDTNVLIHDPYCLTAFEDNHVIIPFVVTEELDHLKGRDGIVGFSARQAARELFKIIEQTPTSEQTFTTEAGGTIRIYTETLIPNTLTEVLEFSKNDNLIIATAAQIQMEHPDEPVIFVTKDVNAHIKARAVGLTVEDYKTDKINADSVYTGYDTVELPAECINSLYRYGHLPFAPTDTILYPNQLVLVSALENPKQTVLTRFDGKSSLQTLEHTNGRAYGLEPRNVEQTMLFSLLMDDQLPFVSVIGPAGTGKTIVSLAVGLQKVLDGEYRRLVLVRPVVAAGEDIGFLPGDESEKLKPWMGSFYDAFERLNDLNGKGRKGKEKSQHERNGAKSADQLLEELRERGLIEMKTFTYMRGRSFYNDFVIIDESQQMTPHLVKLMLTRAGENTKIVMLGDPSDNQIDSLLVDSKSNGLVYAVERLKEHDLSGHITLSQVERSKLSEMAGKLL